SARAGAAPGHGGRGGAGAERRVGLDPPPQDRQRTALRMIARHRGRDAALDRARQLTALLRTELAVAPDAATRALVEEIRKGEIEAAPIPLPSPRRGEGGERSAAAVPVAISAAPPAVAHANIAFWRPPPTPTA